MTENSSSGEIGFGPLFPPGLAVGSKGAAVDALANLLILRRYLVPKRDEYVPDSVYGPVLVRAVKRYQRALRIPHENRDGYFGPQTRAALKEVDGMNVTLIWGRQDQTTWWCMEPGEELRVWQPGVTTA